MRTECDSELNLEEIFSTAKEGEYTVLEFKKPADKLIIYDPGLYHTAICKSALCTIDKRDGKLYYRGVSVTEKAHESFPEVAYFLLFGEGEEGKERFMASLHHHFRLLPEQKALLDVLPASTHPMDQLSIATLNLAGIEHLYLDDANDWVERSAFLMAQVWCAVAYGFTKRCGLPWVEALPARPYPEQILFLLHGGRDPERLSRLGGILNTMMVLHAEHGQNCSAVAVRNNASAKGSVYAAVAAGMSAFNGIIHGGASQLVSAMYEELLASGMDVESYVDQKLARKELVMGFGQRTYNRLKGCWDPRVETMYALLMSPSFDFPEVAAIRDLVVKLIERSKRDPFFTERNLTPNPDLFNCIFYKLFGVPKEMNTVMLALGRIAGWMANYMEHAPYPLTRPCDIAL